MGLDQIAYARRGKPKKVETGTTTWLDGKGVERIEKIFEWEWDDQIQIGEWRNHSALQSWMEAKWISKKRPISKYINKDYYEENVFNNVILKLTKKDIIELSEKVSSGNLFKTYQGISDKKFIDQLIKTDHQYKKIDIKFIECSLEYIKKGYSIIYSSCW